MNHQTPRVVSSIVAAVAVLGLVPAAYGTTLHVSNWGVDGPSCGTTANRCRSITQAIANASLGDTIMVGPGRYGDLNQNGTLGETGEEVGSPGCGCMLSINKPLIVLSSDGAAATVIDAIGSNMNTNVLIIASGVEFGRPNHGFTVTQPKSLGEGIVVDGTNVKIRGNLAVSSPFILSFPAGGDGISTVTNDFATVLIESNQVFGWDMGIVARGARKTVSKNHVSGNNTGIRALGGSGASGRTSVVGNVATSNVTGISASGAVNVVNNAIIGNSVFGLSVSTVSGTIAKNNIFGNGTLFSIIPQNCGLAHEGGNVVAINNYWGAATGPGADPADDLCDDGVSTATTTPFATTPFAINREFEP